MDSVENHLQNAYDGLLVPIASHIVRWRISWQEPGGRSVRVPQCFEKCFEIRPRLQTLEAVEEHLGGKE